MFGFPKQFLAGILESLYFEDQIALRLVCREWNSIIKPLLFCLKANADLSLRFMKGMGTFMVQKSLGYRVVEDLYTIKNYLPNIKCLMVNPCDKFDVRLTSKLLEYFSDSGVSISLRGEACFLAGFKVDSLFMSFVEHPVTTLIGLNQPQLRELDFGFTKDQKDMIAKSMTVICEKFRFLEKLHLWLGDFGGNISNIFPNISSLKTLCLKFDFCQSDIAYSPPETSLRHLVLYERTYQILQSKCPQLRLKGVKEVNLDIHDQICSQVGYMFPDLEILGLNQEYYFETDEEAEVLNVHGPIRVLKLSIYISAPELKFNHLDVWSHVINLSIKCEKLDVVQCALDWVFTCFPCVECLTLIMPKLFYLKASQFQFLDKKKQLSLKKLLSHDKLPLKFLVAIVEIAPNLSLIAFPKDEEAKSFLESKSILVEDLPPRYFREGYPYEIGFR